MRNKMVIGLAIATLAVALSDCDMVKNMAEDVKDMM